MKARLLLMITAVLSVSCGEFLALKPDKKMVVPSTLQDLQALLNNTGFLNQSEEAIGEMSSDNYFLEISGLNLLPESTRMIYTWHKDASSGGSGWSSYYRIILYANQVLEAVDEVEGAIIEKDILKGKALFFRANAYYMLAQLFAVAYDPTNADEQPGLPLRLSPGISQRSVRATLTQTYDQIVDDFTESAALLPERIFEIVSQPNKAAAYLGLARTHLLMEQYDEALRAAESSLAIYDTVLDYNTLNLHDTNPLKLMNEETIYFSRYNSALLLDNSICNVDTVLYGLYDDNDIRKKALFADRPNGTIRFRGNYNGTDSQGIFNGMTTAEAMLIKMECLVRLNRIREGEQAINDFLRKRYDVGEFQSVSFGNSLQALSYIIDERRKELLFRGSRWTDLRRLNRDGNFRKPIFRNINSETHELSPNDNRYVFRIPDDVIMATGMQQNER